MMVLASAALPLARVSMKRQREAELRRDLREMRAASIQFKDWADRGMLAQTELTVGCENYPATLDLLVEGALLANDATGKRKKFLREGADRSDDRHDRLGQTVVPGRARLQGVGRAERLRHLHEGRRQGARRLEIQGLVTPWNHA